MIIESDTFTHESECKELIPTSTIDMLSESHHTCITQKASSTIQGVGGEDENENLETIR
jgi:hypothetical protein